jgi:hypothetical protein
MRLIVRKMMVAVAVLALSASISVAGASTKFSSTEEITDVGHLVVDFEEGSLKRFASVDYQLDATATVASPSLAQLYPDLRASVTLTPDGKGRVAGTLALSDVDLTFGGPCACGGRRVEYFDMTLTNLTTGHVYRLGPISRDYP